MRQRATVTLGDPGIWMTPEQAAAIGEVARRLDGEAHARVEDGDVLLFTAHGTIRVRPGGQVEGFPRLLRRLLHRLHR